MNELAIDFDRMRADRRRRLFAAMSDHGVDVLVLGRPANIAFASGANQLWTAGARPFGPACLVVAATGRVHLLSTWDEGVPPEIGHEDLFGLSWNPAIIAARLRAIDGLAPAARVATDGITPGADQLLRDLCPRAELVDGTPVLSGARTPKTPDELACILTAATLAERALSDLIDALAPGVTEKELLGRYAASISALGCPTPPSEAVAWATPRRGSVPFRHLATSRAVGPGELVVLNPGVLCAGYLGVVARTWPTGDVEPSAGQQRVAARCRRALDAVIEACRPGAAGEALVAAWDATGERPFAAPLASGVGLGAEPPVIGRGMGSTAVLEAGSVLAVGGWVAEDGAGGVFEQDMVQVTENGPEVLTRYGSGPLTCSTC